MVGDNRMRHAMEFEDIIHKTLSHCGCNEQVLKRVKMIMIGNNIYYNQDD
jgi:hypothetical protein